MINAKVTLKFVIKDVCNNEDLQSPEDLVDMIQDIVSSEGIGSLIESDDYQITDVSIV